MDERTNRGDTLVSAHFYIEGSKTGPESKSDQVRCREGFRKLIEKSGFAGKMPRLSACGGRGSTFNDFKTAHSTCKAGDYVAMLVDSEDPMKDVEKAWDHLKARDNWDRPVGAVDEQVLFMATCMETWIAADREALKVHYGHKLQENVLPALIDLEEQHRHTVHEKLSNATRNCSNFYTKGKRSFEVLGVLSPAALSGLPSFSRIVRILTARL